MLRNVQAGGVVRESVMRKLLVFVFGLGLVGCAPEPAYEGKPASAWRKDLKSTDYMAQYHAAVALAHIDPPQKVAIPDLIEALEVPRPGVRREVVRALGHMGPDARAAVPKLIPLLNDRDEKVRKATRDALRDIDPEAAAKAEDSPSP
jgi:hypothetical protein